jgi:hypothetical protein
MANADIVGESYDTLYPAGAFLVTMNAGFTTRFGPTAIAIHYYADMCRHILFVEPA